MKYYIIAGEASGDLHGSNLIKEIKKINPEAEFRCWGGDLMEKAGGKIVKHYRDLAFMGYVEVLMNIRTIAHNLTFCEKDIVNYQPDALILIDYPGFNLRIAKKIHPKGIKVFYYISPQIWAWKKNRIHTIKKFVDKMHVILPFEKDFYKKLNYPVEYVGHPLIDAVNNNFVSQKPHPQLDAILENDSRKIIAILPGSRKQELTKMLPLMTTLPDLFPEYQWIIAGVSWQPAELYHKLTSNPNLKMVVDETYSLLSKSYAAVVTSGTAVLETALFGVPQVVCYKSSRISYEIAKRLVKDIRFVSLVNLILDREVITELIQHDFNSKKLIEETTKILNESHRSKVFKDYDELKMILGEGGASAKMAQSVINQKLVR